MRANGDVVRRIRQNLGLTPDDCSLDSRIATMPHIEQLERYLQWNNIVGFAHLVTHAINEIYGVELKD